ncbi:NEW3 domain-containing protein [Bradyrhizobium japonicum]
MDHDPASRILAETRRGRINPALRPKRTSAPQRLGLGLEGLPEGWEAAFKGGGRQVSAVMVGPDETERLTLELKPPAGISAGTFALKVNARQDGQTISLPLSVRLSEAASGKLTLEPELPALRGTPRSTFSFRIKATNGGSDQSLFNLSARTPEGFQAKFKRGYGSEEITGLPINAGSSHAPRLPAVILSRSVCRAVTNPPKPR